MSQRVVYKYPFGREHARLEVPWADSSRIVLLQAQHPGDVTPTVWIEQPYPLAGAIPRTLELAGTGHVFTEGFEHVGSAVCADGALVWHVYGERR